VFGGGREKSEPLKWKHLDAAKRNWHVPETKKSKPLTVPLSDQAWAIIQEMKALQVNPSPEAKVFPRSKRQLGFALARAGMAGKQTVHGCRALFYTWAKNIDDDGEPLKRDLISAALCHKSETEMDEVYNRGTYLEKRRLLMQRWADYLDGQPQPAARPRLRVV
jgi:integrase